MLFRRGDTKIHRNAQSLIARWVFRTLDQAKAVISCHIDLIMAEYLATNVTVMVTDLDEAIRFYVDLLGLKLKGRYGNHWADIEGPGIMIGLHPSEKTVVRGENLQIALRVKDLDLAVEELTRKGISFRPQTDEQVRIASFQDPDGNTLYLVQPAW